MVPEVSGRSIGTRYRDEVSGRTLRSEWQRIANKKAAVPFAIQEAPRL